MIVLDLHICNLGFMGVVLLAFFVGEILYRIPQLAPAPIPQADHGTNGSALPVMCSLAPYWQGGRSSSPRPRLSKRRWACLLISSWFTRR
jgi:hypothetical protein